MEEKNSIEIESEDEQIFLGFDNDGEAVVPKDYWVVLEQLLLRNWERNQE